MAEDVQPTTGGHLRDKNKQKPHWSAASSEDGHMATFEGAQGSEDAHIRGMSIFGGGKHLGGTWTKPAFEIIANAPNASPWHDQYPPNSTTLDGDLLPHSDGRVRGDV